MGKLFSSLSDAGEAADDLWWPGQASARAFLAFVEELEGAGATDPGLVPLDGGRDHRGGGDWYGIDATRFPRWVDEAASLLADERARTTDPTQLSRAIVLVHRMTGAWPACAHRNGQLRVDVVEADRDMPA